jgi:hypothetical protein
LRAILVEFGCRKPAHERVPRCSCLWYAKKGVEDA